MQSNRQNMNSIETEERDLNEENTKHDADERHPTTKAVKLWMRMRKTLEKLETWVGRWRGNEGRNGGYGEE